MQEIQPKNGSLKLNQVKVGQSVRVSHVLGEGALRQRILDMGLTRGAEVTVRKMAPLGDPLEVTVRGYQLSLRKAEAACILVE
ncbi:MAG: ferrous iron transport protein A [Akkermansia sp.]|nr:ferrous iron transport protein A [Akkermansia sp.]